MICCLLFIPVNGRTFRKETVEQKYRMLGKESLQDVSKVRGILNKGNRMPVTEVAQGSRIRRKVLSLATHAALDRTANDYTR